MPLMSNHILPLFAAVGAPGGPRPRRRPYRPHRPELPAEETGRWIWARGVEPRNSYIHARKVFQLDAPPEKAVVKALADSGYRLYVNGSYVGQGPARSGADWTYYDTFDVTSLLHKGDNVIACLAHHIGEDTYSYVAGKPGLLCKIEIDGAQGQRVIPSDETWKARRADDWTAQGARISKGLAFQEVYDSGLRAEDWAEVRFRDKDWDQAEVVGAPGDGPWGDLVKRQSPNLLEERVYPAAVSGVYGSPQRAKETTPEQVPDLMAASQLVPLRGDSIRSAECLLTADGQTRVATPRGDGGVAVVLDFGREVSGNVEIGIAGSTQGVIDLGYGELLEEGHVKPNRGDAKYTDRILLKKGRFEWRSFAPRAFRYLQMEFRWCGKPVAIDYVRVDQTTYPIGQAGTFECSNAMLNDIWKAGVNTARLCMQDILVDSPRLERAQWWGDARIISRVAYSAFGDTALLANGLMQFARAQRRDGSIPGLYPSGEEKMVPDFALLWVFSVLDYFAFSGDAGLVSELYPNVRQLLEWFRTYLDEDGLLRDVPGNPFIDWKEIDSHGNLTAMNCLYHQALRATAFIASVVGRDADAEEILQSAAALKLAINKFLYHPKRGLYATSRVDGKLADEFDPQTNTLAVLCDLADQYQKSSILRWVLSCPPDEIATPYFASYVLEALYSAERYDEALEYMKKRWGVMVADGASPGVSGTVVSGLPSPETTQKHLTLWEEFTRDGGLCQGWATSPARDLVAEYVGIKPVPMPSGLEMGAGRFSVAPHTGDLAWASGSVVTKFGELSVSWRKSRNQFMMKIVVPNGLRVDVYPPGPPEATVVLDGRPHPSRFLGLTGGAHQIKVTEPRPAKPAKPQIGLEPAPIPHVEVLDSGLRPARRSTRQPARRTRPGRTSAPVREGEATAEPVVAAPPVEVRPETVAPQAEPGQPKPRRRRPRTSRGGARHRKPQDQTPKASGQEPAEPGPSQESAKPEE
jgi:alpha-L-rhamnosidase